MSDFASARAKMVAHQIAGRGISNARLLDAMRTVPREEFVPAHLRSSAYDDSPLPIEAEQTISQPYIVALMIDAASVKENDRVLEVGAGSGYAAAVLGRMAGQVFAIERHRQLAELASERMKRLNYQNVTILSGDGTKGVPDEAPFDVILAAASGSHVPDGLLAQLKVGGRLVMPVGEPDSIQKLVRAERVGEDEYRQDDLGQVRFVPLIGVHGWKGAGT